MLLGAYEGLSQYVVSCRDVLMVMFVTCRGLSQHVVRWRDLNDVAGDLTVGVTQSLLSTWRRLGFFFFCFVLKLAEWIYIHSFILVIFIQ